METFTDHEGLYLDLSLDRNELLEQVGVRGVFRLPVQCANGEVTTLGYAHVAHSSTKACNAIVIPAEHASDFRNVQEGFEVFEWEGDRYFFHNPDQMTVEETKERILFNRRNVREAAKSQSDVEVPECKDSPLELGRISVAEAAAMVTQTDPKNCLFYTGAGLSVGEQNGVWTYKKLCQNLGINEQATSESLQGNRRFAEAFLAQPNQAERALQLLKTFMRQLEFAEPTKAHWAFAATMHALNHDPLTATTNIDWLHQRTGLAVPFVTVNNQKRPQAYLEQDKWFDEQLSERMSSFELAVVMGRSNDSRHLIRTIREHHPAMQCIIFNTDTQGFAYAQRHDVVVQGDCQVTVPAFLGHLAL